MLKKSLLSLYQRAPGKVLVAPFVGYIEDRNDREIVGWVSTKTAGGKQPYVVILDGTEVVSISMPNIFRADVAEHIGCDPVCGFAIDTPEETSNGIFNLTIAAMAPEVSEDLLALCEERDQSNERYKVEVDRVIIKNKKVYYPIPNILSLKSDILAGAQSRGGTFEIIRNSTLIEITDLLSFLQYHNTVTGIQRTVCGIVASLLSSNGVPHRPFHFCALSDQLGKLFIFREDLIHTLVDNVLNEKRTLAQLKQQIDTIYATALVYIPDSNDTVLISGAYWIVQDFDRKILALKRRGVIVGTYIYDIIPITAPQWVASNTNREVLEAAFSVFSLSDYFITISEFVRKDLSRLLIAELGSVKPIKVAALPHEIPPLRVASRARSITYPYVLCVCTLEGRKNHIMLYRVWSGLMRKHGEQNIPILILVGKWGWKIEDFKDACIQSNFLNGKIVIRSGVSDEELISLYKGCLFTVFPSFIEGWGLPVGESLSFGKFCVASNTSSIPEVGGEFVDYFDPHSYEDAFSIIEKPLINKEYLFNRTQNIIANFKARTWDDLATVFIRASQELSNTSRQDKGSSETIPPLLESGVIWTLSGQGADQTVSWRHKKTRFILSADWYPVEHWGVWSSASRSEISFRTDLPAGSSAKIWLSLKIPNSYNGELIAAICGDKLFELPPGTVSEKSRWFEIKAVVGDRGLISVLLCRPKSFALRESRRRLLIGLSDVIFCDYNNKKEEISVLRNIANIVSSGSRSI